MWTLPPGSRGTADVMDHLVSLKQQGVLSYTFGALVNGNRFAMYGYHSSVRRDKNRTYTGQQLDNQLEGLQALGWFLMEYIDELVPGGRLPDQTFMHLEIDLGDEHSSPTITGRAYALERVSDFQDQPVRLL